MIKLPKTKKYYTLDTRDNQFEELNANMIDKLKSLLSSLEENPYTLLCARGDCHSLNNIDEHNNFFSYDYMSKFYRVGAKAKSNIKRPKKKEYEYFEDDNEVKLIDELKTIIKRVNRQIEKKMTLIFLVKLKRILSNI
ncbi:MAG: hypothetical protein KU38_00240 [Sulfurovum sp. FS08-3]|nr:MAG: hypothetical protein KU38_00240 [Sulfurovum sp. FS08-3]